MLGVSGVDYIDRRTGLKYSPWVIVDLDGTLCDTTHRQAMIDVADRSRTDWEAYSMACTTDGLITATKALVVAIGRDFNVCVLSGRNSSALPETVEWLGRHRVLADYIQLRPKGDHRSNPDLKVDFVRTALSRRWKIELAVDDYPAIKWALSSLSIPVLLVQPPSRHPLSQGTLHSPEWEETSEI